MKIKTQLTLASVIAAGLLASGCSTQQLVAQQGASVQAAPVIESAPVVDVVQQDQMVKTIVDCSSCHRPAPRPQIKPRPPQPRPRGGNMHSHQAIAGCTDAVRHNHPHPQGANHSHKYSCNKPVVRSVPRPVVPRPVAPRTNPNAHTHPAIPNCTRSVRHVHANGGRTHKHSYACQRPAAPRPVYRPAPVTPPVYRPAPRPVYQQPAPVMPKVKAKGTYRGPIKIDGMMQQYQQ